MPAEVGTDVHKWWKEAVVYQIYPSTFKDSNGDGWGDLNGITSKLDYIKHLGIDVVWLSPIYKSPNADMGYDIADYKDIDPVYGTLEDVDNLIAELGKRNMKLMMDLVVNHTSDQHAWFLESKASKDNPKHDWYIWKPPKGFDADGKPIPPNNWCMILGYQHSGWHFVESRGEFYLGLFTKEQPDLNWENPDVRAAVHDVMEFWLKRGACGFRMDVINHISKDQRYLDADVRWPDAKYQMGDQWFANGPRLHEWLKDMNEKVLSKYGAMTVGETPFVQDEEEILRTVAFDRKELDMIFIFDIVSVGVNREVASDALLKAGTIKGFTAVEIAAITTKWQNAMTHGGGWNSLFLENHDQPRSVGRYVDGSDKWREKGAKLLAIMQTTLAGTLYVYQGEEIGMRNVPIQWDMTEFKDVATINQWLKVQLSHGHDPELLELERQAILSRARDNARTPMQWDASANAGFCPATVKPWMTANDDYKEINAEAQQKDGAGENGISPLRFWQRCLALRKQDKLLWVYGDYKDIGSEQKTKEQVFAYTRAGDDGSKAAIALNFTGKDVKWEMPAGLAVSSWILTNYGEEEYPVEKTGEIILKPWQGVVGRLE